MGKKLGYCLLAALGAGSLLFGCFYYFTQRNARLRVHEQRNQVDFTILQLRRRLLEAELQQRKDPAFRDILNPYESRSEMSSSSSHNHLELVLDNSYHSIRRILEENRKGTFYPYEDGLEGTRPLVSYAAQFDTPTNVNQALLNLSALQEFTRGFGLWETASRLSTENILLLRLIDSLHTQKYSRTELRGFETRLNSLFQTRPALLDEFTVDYVRWKKEIILIADDSTRNSGIFRSQPLTMRIINSTALQCSDLLSDFNSIYDIVLLTERLPTWERSQEFSRLRSDRSKLRISDFLRGSEFYEDDAKTQKNWIFAKVSIAIAQYQSEKSTLPDSINSLIPMYLTALPISPVSGRPITLLKGRPAQEPK